MTTTRRPRRIVLAGAGGSCGKTTEGVTIGSLMAVRGQRVRFVDLDGQGDASQYVNYPYAPYVIGEALIGAKVYPYGNGGLRAPTLAEIEQPVYRASMDDADKHGGLTSPRPEVAAWLQRMSIIPSGVGSSGTTLPAAVSELERTGMGADKFRSALQNIDVAAGTEPVDFEIYDLHGTVGWLTYHVLAIADKVITTVVPDDKTTGRHLDELLAIIAEVAEFNHRLRLDAIIPVRCRPKRDGQFYDEVITDLESSDEYGSIVTPRVREAVVVPESFKQREPLPLYVPNDAVTKDNKAVLEWLDERGVTSTSPVS
jgi:cellulose biosynthesis protein BcsQ